jgi:hypothetical protein
MIAISHVKDDNSGNAGEWTKAAHTMAQVCSNVSQVADACDDRGYPVIADVAYLERYTDEQLVAELERRDSSDVKTA